MTTPNQMNTTPQPAVDAAKKLVDQLSGPYFKYAAENIISYHYAPLVKRVKELERLIADKQGIHAGNIAAISDSRDRAAEFAKLCMVERDQLRARIAELEKDRERLDWLENNGHELHITCWKGVGCMANPWTIHRGDFAETEPIGESDVLRAAIDAARAKEDAK